MIVTGFSRLSWEEGLTISTHTRCEPPSSGIMKSGSPRLGLGTILIGISAIANTSRLLFDIIIGESILASAIIIKL